MTSTFGRGGCGRECQRANLLVRKLDKCKKALKTKDSKAKARSESKTTNEWTDKTSDCSHGEAQLELHQNKDGNRA